MAAVIRNKRRSMAWVGAILLGGYGIVCGLVGCSSSPTDEVVSLVDGRSVAVMRWQTGEPAARIVLVHGAPADASSWNRLKRESKGGQVNAEWVAIDRVGYGHSTLDESLVLADHAATLLPFLESAPGDRVILVGQSYGGPVVLRAAADYPDRIAGIVLIAGACDANMGDSKWLRHTVEFISPIVPTPWVVANRELLALTDENLAMQPLLLNVRCPVVVLHGTWDPVCPYTGTVEYLKSQLVGAKDVKVVTIDMGGHNLHLSQVSRVLDELQCLVDAPRD